jgi:Fe-S-cluster containining protein
LDLRRLAECLELSDEEFFLEYCEIVDLHLAQRVSLIAEENGDCVFLGDAGCEVYEHRPLQCQTFPFWPTNLLDEQAWQEAGRSCPGINQGRCWSSEEISECVKRRERDPLLDVGDGS